MVGDGGLGFGEFLVGGEGSGVGSGGLTVGWVVRFLLVGGWTGVWLPGGLM